MKKAYLYSLPGEPSDTLRSALRGVTAFTEYRLDRDFRKHNTHNTGPVVVIDVDNEAYKEVLDPAAIATAWSSAPTSLRRNLARIITKDANGQPKTEFTVTDLITVRVEIWKPDNSAIETSFNGTFYVPFFDSSGQTQYIRMVFSSGVAERVVGQLRNGRYMVTKESSSLVDVIRHEIIVGL